MIKVIKSNTVNKDIIQLSKEYSKIFDNKIPILYNQFYESEYQILFIGLNPSFSENLKKGFNGNEEDYDKFFTKTIANNDIEKIIQAHEKSIENYPYFNKFKEIEKSTGLKFAHVDLFHCRRTSQSKFVEILDNKEYEFFIEKSISILKELINQIKPKIIVIENTKTRDILSRDFNHFPKIDDVNSLYGTPVLGNTPIFYTSMLTGQRALDLGSFHRLVWHIKNCISILEK